MSITELEECIHVCGADVYTFCLHLTNNRTEADELYQNTFLLAVEKLDHIDMEGNPKSYFLSVALRIWQNERRKFAWRQRIARMESFEAQAQESSLEERPSPEEDVVAREEGRLVRRCIRELEDRYRIPVYLFYMEELSVGEIASVLRLPRGTVKSRLHKARQLLKKKLEVG